MTEKKIIAYLNKELDNSEMLEVDRWMASSTGNIKTFNEVRERWQKKREEKFKEKQGEKERSRAKPATTNSGEKLVPVQTSNKSRALVIFLAVAIAVIGMVMAIFLGASPDN